MSQRGAIAMPESAFPTPLLDAKLAQQRAENEVARQALLPAVLLWLRQHGAEYGIKHGYVFGSVMQAGWFTEQSDVDVAIESFREGDPFALSGWLSLQVNREVDIVPLDQCHFAEKIRQTGIPWNVNESQD